MRPGAWKRTLWTMTLVTLVLKNLFRQRVRTLLTVAGIAIGIFVLVTDPRIVRRWRLVAGCVLAAAAGLLPYLYLPLAASQHPPLNWGDPESLPRFLAHVTRAQYGTFALGPGQAASRLEQVGLLAWYFFHGFTVLGYAIVGVGAWWLAERPP